MYNTIILIDQGGFMGRKLTNLEFITKAELKHSGLFTYSKTNYVNSYSKVTITCKLHGDFLQLPRNHLHGQGCPTCSGCTIKTSHDFILDAVSVHGSKYSYVNSKYKNGITDVFITCELHGDFLQRPNHHLAGHGCPFCGSIVASNGTRLSVSSFIIKAKIKHGDKYDYSNVNYKNVDTPVDIVCPSHGIFAQRPYNHYRGVGCPSCAKTGFNPLKLAYIYVLLSECGNHMKIGITGNTKNRLSVLKNKTPFTFHVIEVFDIEGKYAQSIERTLHALCLSSGFSGFDGCSEWFEFNRDVVNTMSLVLS